MGFEPLMVSRASVARVWRYRNLTITIITITRAGALSTNARLTSVCLSLTSGLSREQWPRKTKIGTE